MSGLSLLYNYFLYRLKSTTEHGVHSPFIFDLVTNVVYNSKDYYCYKSIEAQRKKMLDSATFIDEWSISKLTKKAPSEKHSKLLFRLVNYFQPNAVVVITDDVGILTAYVVSVSRQLKVYSVQKNEAFTKIKTSNFNQLKQKNVNLISEHAGYTLSGLMKQVEVPVFLVINQATSEAVLHIFNQCLSQFSASTVIVIFNVGTPEISPAWEQIKNNIQVTVTVDLFYMGIVFFRKEQVKQHFLIRF